jgi:predicted MFS family arabinose efflux permease
MFVDSYRSLRSRTGFWMLLAGVLISFTAGGYVGWFPKFIDEYQGLDPLEATKRLFWIVMTAGPAGVVVGGLVADWLYRRRRHGRPLAIALGFLLACPCALGAIYSTGLTFYVFAWLICFFLPWYNGPMAAVIDDIVDDDKAATAQGAFSTVLHLLGTAPGFVVVGFLVEPVGLREALLVPTAAVVLAAVCCVIGSRHVVADMAARRRA